MDKAGAAALAEQVFWSKPPQTLYHYTTPQGLLGILQSGQLWATDWRFLNDTSEGSYARRILKDMLLEVRGATELDAAKAEAMANKIAESIERHPGAMYVTCFSLAQDALEMWRGYGKEGAYCIAFDGDKLKALLKAHFGAVDYGLDIYGTSFVKAIKGYFDPEGAGHSPTQNPALSAMVPLIKDPAFRHEREWRAVYARNDLHLRRQFTPSSVGPKPFCLFPEKPTADQSLPIIGITVGPTPHQLEYRLGAELALETYGYKGIDVIPSVVPYRS